MYPPDELDWPGQRNAFSLGYTLAQSFEPKGSEGSSSLLISLRPVLQSLWEEKQPLQKTQ